MYAQGDGVAAQQTPAAEPAETTAVSTPSPSAETTEVKKEEPTTEKNKQVSQEIKLKAAVVENKLISVPATQNIVVSAEYTDEASLSGILQIENQDTGEVRSYESTDYTDGAVKFSVPYTDESEAGSYKLVSVTLSAGDVSQKFDFETYGIEAKYGVNKTVATDPDAVIEKKEDTASDDQEGVVTLDTSTLDTSALTDELMTVSAAQVSNVYTVDNPLIVVIDPGHGTETDLSGAIAVDGTWESTLNMKIALYCKAALERNNNVKVYLTHSYVGEKIADNLADDLIRRTEIARKKVQTCSCACTIMPAVDPVLLVLKFIIRMLIGSQIYIIQAAH